MAANRIEKDSMGSIEVPADKLWALRLSARWNTFASPRKKCPLS